jgi:hypothetical protein
MKDNTSLINTLATEVIEETFKDENVAKQYYIDPLTIILVISILLTLIRIIQECRKKRTKLFSMTEKYSYFHSEIHSLCFNNTLFTRMRIKSAIKEHLSTEQYNRYGKALLNAIVKVGCKISQEQTTALLEYKHV